MKHINEKIHNLQNRVADKLRGRDVYFLWSGGDDSTALLKILIESKVQSICNIQVITVPFPQHVYYKEHLVQAQAYLNDIGMNSVILYTNSHIDYALPHTEACGVCKEARRTVFMDYYRPLQKKGDIIITAHNLSDLMSYYIELVIEKLSTNELPQKADRKLEVINKFLEFYDTEVGTELFRPLIEFSQVEIQFILNRMKFDNGNLDIIENKCLWVDQRKRLLQAYFQKAHIVSEFAIVHGLLLDDFGIPSISDFQTLPFETYLV